jgi:hypothetical protein
MVEMVALATISAAQGGRNDLLWDGNNRSATLRGATRRSATSSTIRSKTTLLHCLAKEPGKYFYHQPLRCCE